MMGPSPTGCTPRPPPAPEGGRCGSARPSITAPGVSRSGCDQGTDDDQRVVASRRRCRCPPGRRAVRRLRRRAGLAVGRLRRRAGLTGGRLTGLTVRRLTVRRGAVGRLRRTVVSLAPRVLAVGVLRRSRHFVPLRWIKAECEPTTICPGFLRPSTSGIWCRTRPAAGVGAGAEGGPWWDRRPAASPGPPWGEQRRESADGDRCDARQR